MRFLLNPEVRPVWGSGNEPALLAAYERVWERKHILRRLYETWYEQIAAGLRDGCVVEVGAGTGNFKRWLQPRSCWTLDILPGRFVDVQADALRLPFREGSLDNIVMIDALHHFARPRGFLHHAATVLKTGGRLVLVEPFVSVWGWFVWKFLHHERVDFGFEETTAPKEAWDGNAAIPRLVLDAARLGDIPVRVVRMSYCEWLSYPLSGGFSYRPLLPSTVLRWLHKIERRRLFQNRLLSLRVIAILEKLPPTQPTPGT
jgi:SAM-dependent methyltransferase